MATAQATQARGTRPLTGAGVGTWSRIEHLDGPAGPCRRLLDLGLTPGEELVVAHRVPLGGPLVVMIRGTRVALRRQEARWIRIR
jgi:Fe2+ transport system protein FeoA